MAKINGAGQFRAGQSRDKAISFLFSSSSTSSSISSFSFFLFFFLFSLFFFPALAQSSMAVPCTSVNSTIINSVTESINKNCIITNSSIVNSVVEDSTIYNSAVDSSTITDSVIRNSTLLYSNQTHSTIVQSGTCQDMNGYFAFVLDNILSSGRIAYGSYSYYGPANLTLVCSGLLPPKGYVISNKTIVRNTDQLRFSYFGRSGSTITLNISDLDSNAATIGMTDGNNDGIYYADATVSAGNSRPDGSKIIFAKIVDNLGNTLYAYHNMTLDNTLPQASFIFSEGNTTFLGIVTLQLNYSDGNGVGSCAFQNNNSDFSDAVFEQCAQTKQWKIISGLGFTTVYFSVRDNAGNMRTVNATIERLEKAYDETPPTVPAVFDGLESDDLDLFNSNTTLSAHWSGSIDYESRYVFYKYRILANGTNITGFIDAGQKTQAKADGLALLGNTTYSFEVQAANPWNISNTGNSDGAVLDLVMPNITSLNSSTHPLENTTYANTSAVFIWAAYDNNAIRGYSFVLDENPSTAPDGIIDTNDTNASLSGISSGASYFHLKALDWAGNSIVSHKKIDVLSSAPRIVLVQGRTETAEPSINITGNVSIGSNITFYVNNANQANLSADGNFSLEIMLTNGTNTIYAIAHRGAASATSNQIIVRKVERQEANLTVTLLFPAIGTAIDRMAYTSASGHLFGFATESTLAAPSANPSLSITASDEDPAMIFLASPDVDIAGRNKDLRNKEFLDSASPSFRFSGKKNYAGVFLSSDKIALSGNSSAELGRYKIYIENMGKENGKTKLKIEIK